MKTAFCEYLQIWGSYLICTRELRVNFLETVVDILK